MAIDDDILREFLIESFENLTLLDQDMVELEQQPDRQDLLAGIFRTIHTIKGTCGFLGFTRLESLAHVTEDILNELRQQKRVLDSPLTNLILETADAIKRILNSIQSGAGEGDRFEDGLVARLRGALERSDATGPAAESPGAPEPAADTRRGRDTGRAAEAQPSSLTNTGLRVDVGLLDRLMNLVGELVLTRNQVLQFNSPGRMPR